MEDSKRQRVDTVLRVVRHLDVGKSMLEMVKQLLLKNEYDIMAFCNLLYMHHQLIQMSVIDRASVECVPVGRGRGRGGEGERERERLGKIGAEGAVPTDLPLILLHSLHLLPKQLKVLKEINGSKTSVLIIHFHRLTSFWG